MQETLETHGTQEIDVSTEPHTSRHHQSAFEYERKDAYGFSVKEGEDDEI
jgi:hypothetical protein